MRVVGGASVRPGSSELVGGALQETITAELRQSIRSQQPADQETQRRGSPLYVVARSPSCGGKGPYQAQGPACPLIADGGHVLPLFSPKLNRYLC